MLNIARFFPKTTAAGPGKRAVLWLQGCLKRCPGCITPEMQPVVEKQVVSINKLVSLIKSINGISGITIYGGEPLLQAGALCLLAEYLQKYNKSVMLYSGYTLAAIRACSLPAMQRLLKNTDILVAGPYIDRLNHNQMWRGSSNQKILLLSDRYKTYARKKLNRERKLCIHRDGMGGYLIIGIPPKGFNYQLQGILKNE